MPAAGLAVDWRTWTRLAFVIPHVRERHLSDRPADHDRPIHRYFLTLLVWG